MKAQKSTLGKIDYFSSIDKLADDFMPTKGLSLPASKTNEYNFMEAMVPQKKLKYDPTKQKLAFLPEKKRFDPFMGSWANTVHQTLHVGPAVAKQLNSEQVHHLIHELRTRGYSYSEANKIAGEAKTLSKKYMNSPWDNVPAKYQKKFGQMDFDGDGVINSKDCKPFDYDLQGPYWDSITGRTPTLVVKSTPAPVTKTVAPAPATKSTPTDSSGKINLYTPGSANYYAQQVSNQQSKVIAPAYRSGSTGEQVSYDAGKTWTNTIPPLVTSNSTGTSISVVTPVASSSTVYQSDKTGGEQVSYDGGKTWVNTGAGGDLNFYAGIGTPGTVKTTTYIPGTPGTPGTSGTSDEPIYGTQTDYDKQQRIFDEILKGKQLDPMELSYMKSIYNPIEREAKSRMGVLQARVTKQEKFQGAAGITSDPGAYFLNQANIKRANEIYNARQTDIQNKQSKLTTAANEAQIKRLGEAANAELKTRGGEFTSTIQIGTRMGSPGTSGTSGTPGTLKTEVVPLVASNATNKTAIDLGFKK